MKIDKLRAMITVLALMLIFTGCSSNKFEKENDDLVPLTISAAVSLTDALEVIKDLYEQDYDAKITFNLAGSGTLAQQISQGAPVDLFISANNEWMDTLDEKELIISSTREHVTGNNLVLIADKESSLPYRSFDEIASHDVGQIAIGNPASVPAGQYTKETLTSLGIWNSLQDHLVLAKDVRQVLTYVNTGNADLGFVYGSDALHVDDIQILATAQVGDHDPIVYPGAVVAHTKHKKEAEAFLQYLLTDEAQDVLAKYGFKK